jgi:ubiquinone/menaquinone biosynthesis C-methylase UbiE
MLYDELGVREYNLQDLCWDGEEKFDYAKSRLYALTLRWRRGFVDFVAKDVLSRNPRSVLDVGCGSCDILAQLQGREIELYGIDPSPHMLKLAKKKIRDSGPQADLSSVHLSLGNSRFIPFERKFDIIFSSLSFHHWKNREENIPYILSRLDEDGEFTIYEYNRDALSFLPRKILGKHALSAIDVKGLDFDGYKKTIEQSGSFIVVRFRKT